MHFVIIDTARQQEIAALVKAGYPVEKISAKTGLSEQAIANIASGTTVKARATAARRTDVKAALAGALSVRKALQRDGTAMVPAALRGIVGTRDEIDPAIAGLERHLMVAWMRGNRQATIDSMLRVGVEDAWTSIDMVAGRYIFPRDNPCTEHLRSEVGWGRLSWYLDVVVECMAQAINPSALVVVGNTMDWGLWRLRAEYMVRHPDIVENFDSWKTKVEITSSRDEAMIREPTKVPWITISKEYIAEKLSRFVMILLNPPINEPDKITALANVFPISTWYTGKAMTWHGQDKQDTMPAVVIDALVPANTIQLLVDHAGAVASLVVPSWIAMPEVRTIDISYPDGYPSNDIGSIFARGARRASAMPEQRIVSLAEQWTDQQKLNDEARGA
jgi:hypothetical protein